MKIKNPAFDEIDPFFKSYILDDLKERERIDDVMHYQIKKIFEKSVNRIIEKMLEEHGVKSRQNASPTMIKPLSPTLSSFIDSQASRVGEELFSTIQMAIFTSVFSALSPMARIKMDEFLFKKRIRENRDLQERGVMYVLGIGFLNTYSGTDAPIGEASNKESFSSADLPIIKSIQQDIIAQSDAIAKSSMQKKQIFNGKEFTISSGIWDTANNNVNIIKDLIKSNVNKDVTKLARALDTYVQKGKSKACSEYPNMMRRLKGRIPGYISFAAYRLARNEIAEITFQASLQDYVKNPFVEACKWLLANNRLKKYEDACACNDLAFQDVYGLGRGVYPLDKVPDRPHIMCLCTLSPISSRKLKKAIQDGMTIGNVPTKKWLESGNEELNAKVIKDKQNKYGATLFHNEEQKALQNACIQAIKSHDWFLKGVKDVDKSIFIADLRQVNGLGLFMLARYSADMKVDLYCDIEKHQSSKYNIIENKIYCNLYRDSKNLDNKAMNFKLGMRSFLHESGHWLDSNVTTGGKYGIVKKLKNLYNKIEADVLNCINTVGKMQLRSWYTPLKSTDKDSLDKLNLGVSKAVTEKIRENGHINSNVSDIYGAVTQDKIAGQGNGMYGHGKEYWRHGEKEHYEKVMIEFVAEAFESLGNLQRMEAMQKYLPTAWNYFTSTLQDFILGKWR